MRELVIVVVLCALASPVWAQGVMLSYQGQLSEAGTPHSGLVDLEFRLYDSPTSGSQVGATVTRSSVPVTDGLFQAELDFTVFDFETSGSLYLDVTVDGITLSPRQRVTAAPVAAYALWSPAGSGSPWDSVNGGLAYDSGDVRINTTSFNEASLRVDAESNFDGVHASSSSNNGYAVWGVSSSGNGRGVYGLNSATTGTGVGVYGRSSSPDGTAGFFTGSGTGLYAQSTTQALRRDDSSAARVSASSRPIALLQRCRSHRVASGTIQALRSRPRQPTCDWPRTAGLLCPAERPVTTFESNPTVKPGRWVT